MLLAYPNDASTSFGWLVVVKVVKRSREQKAQKFFLFFPTKYNNLRAIHALLVPPFLTETVILHSIPPA